MFNIQQILYRYHGNILLRSTLRIPMNTFWQTVFSQAGLFRSQCDQMQEKTTEEEKTELLSRGKTKCQNIGLCLCHRAVCHCRAGEQRHCDPIAKCSCMTIYMTYNAQIIAPSAWITLGFNCKYSFRRSLRAEVLMALWLFKKAISHTTRYSDFTTDNGCSQHD